MIQKLNNVMVQETEALRTLLIELEDQHRCIASNDIFGLEACVKKIKEANKIIASMEVQRRQLTENRDMKAITQEFHDNEFENNYYQINQLLKEIVLQKDTNELLIKQGLSFTNRILNVLNPVRETSTYNAYGKVKK
jgi:flagellar biosynthesis/type III secretory pathway chaperone